MSITKNTPNFLKHSRKPFTTLLNTTLDIIKDPGALGIYVYLSSKPEDWQISVTNLQNRFGKGKNYILARMSELKLLSLLRTIPIRHANGCVEKWETILYNEPQPAENKDSIQIHCFPDSGSSTFWIKGTQQIKDLKQIKEENKYTPAALSASQVDKSLLMTLEEMKTNNPHDIDHNQLAEWFLIRKKKKSPLTHTAWNRANSQLKKLALSGLDPKDCFEQAVSRGWTGIEFRFFEQELKSTTVTSKSDMDKEIRARELKAQEEKRREIDASKSFLNLVTEAEKRSKHIGSSNIMEMQEAERRQLGMSAMQYHQHILKQGNR